MDDSLSHSPYFGRVYFCEKNGIKDGPFIGFYRNGKKMNEGFYKTGLLHGIMTNYYKNGNTMNRAEYMNGKAVKSTSWFENGVMSEKILINGTTQHHTTWHATGKMQRKLTAIDHIPCDTILSWDEFGEPAPADSYYQERFAACFYRQGPCANRVLSNVVYFRRKSLILP